MLSADPGARVRRSRQRGLRPEHTHGTVRPASAKQQASVRVQTTQGVNVAIVNCEFERGTADFQISVRPNGQIAGFFVRPSA